MASEDRAEALAASGEGDEAYLEHLYRGSGLMASGDLRGAKEELEKALGMRPHHAKVLGLLGLCYFKLGELEEAAAVYSGLAHENPLDVTVHVNLGLVELKRGNPRGAIRALEIATSLAPDHKKAFNYLGLAYSEIEEYERARDAFREAGTEAMVEKMERLMASPAEEPAASPVEEAPQPEESATPEVEGPRISSMARFTEETRLVWPRGSPFAVDEEGVAIDFANRIFTRLDGLLVARGNVSWEPVRKRFRGQATDRSFGSGAKQLWCGMGSGQLIIARSPVGGSGTRLFTVLRLEEDAFFAEERLYAFEESLEFENGRVTGEKADLHLVRLRGAGHLLLVTEGPIRSESVYGNESVRLPVDRLVGWWGPLTPKRIEDPAGPWVELAGEGHVLLAA